MSVSRKARIESISPSALNSFNSCNYRFALDYVERLPDSERIPVTAFVFGSVVHSTIAHFNNLGGKKNLTSDDLVSILMRKWEHRPYVNEEASLRDFDRARDIVETFHSSPYPQTEAKCLVSEATLRWRRQRLGFLAKGKLDRVVQHEDSTIEVIDYKTSATPLSTEELQSDYQALFYHSLVADRYNHLSPKEIKITFYYLPISNPVWVVFDKATFDRGWASIKAALGTIRSRLDLYNLGLPLDEAFPKNRSSNCATCPMSQHCNAQIVSFTSKVQLAS